MTPPSEVLSPYHRGNGELWTVLWPYGAVLIDPDFVQPDGTLGMKFPWWQEVAGTLAVEGWWLDAPAPPPAAMGAAVRPVSSQIVRPSGPSLRRPRFAHPPNGCATIGTAPLGVLGAPGNRWLAG